MKNYCAVAKCPLGSAQHTEVWIRLSLWEFGQQRNSMPVKVLQNIAKSLADPGHNDLAYCYTAAASRLFPTGKAEYIAAVACKRGELPIAAFGVLKRVRGVIDERVLPRHAAAACL